jgi:S-adenosylmethionine hydrolase
VAIVTLTSDFGTKDYLVGAFKGRLLKQLVDCNIVDITHEVEPFNFAEAAYIIQNSIFEFPEHTYHLLLVNLFDATQSLPLLAFHKGHYLGSADNGLLPMVAGSLPELTIKLPLSENLQYNTLAWADVFADAIHKIESGKSFHHLGEEPDSIVEKISLQANYGEDFIDGRIIFIDRFENVVVNITRQDFERIGKGRTFSIAFKSKDYINKISDGYPQVNEGSKLAFFNAAGYLEIAVNKGNAAGLFGLKTFSERANPEFIKSRMFYQTVRILFG